MMNFVVVDSVIQGPNDEPNDPTVSASVILEQECLFQLAIPQSKFVKLFNLPEGTKIVHDQQFGYHITTMR